MAHILCRDPMAKNGSTFGTKYSFFLILEVLKYHHMVIAFGD
jgi:hypothetical protein